MNIFEWFTVFAVLGFAAAWLSAFYWWVIHDTNDIMGEDKVRK